MTTMKTSMKILIKSVSFNNSNIFQTFCRSLSTTVPLRLKEIKVSNINGNISIEGLTVTSPRTDLLVKPKICSHNQNDVCYMCALGLDVKHTDVLILSQFVRSDGCMLPRRITGLCSRQQKKIGKMVTMAQKAGLMINLTPANCKKDPTLRYQYKKFNTYFDESTIFQKKQPEYNDRYKR